MIVFRKFVIYSEIFLQSAGIFPFIFVKAMQYICCNYYEKDKVDT